MGKRILAWTVLIGFVLLIANIIFIGYQRMLSFGIYAVIVLIFLFTNRKNKKS